MTLVRMITGVCSIKRLVGLIVIGLGLAVAPVGYAHDSLSLNQGAVTIDQQSTTALRRAMPKAMGQVLVKLSGNASVLTIPAISSQLAQAQDLVTSYRYVAKTDNQQQQVVITFNREALTQLLQQAGQSIWTGSRPTTLLWVQQQSSSGVHVVSAGDDSMARQELSRVAQQRGMPVLFPMMDLQEASSVGVEQVNNNSSLWHGLLQRYGVNSLVTAAVSQEGSGKWQAEWTLRLNGQELSWQDHQPSQQALLAAGANRAADMMAGQAMMSAGNFGSDHVSLIISGVGDLVDYADIVAYLNKLSMVDKTVVKDMRGSTLLVSVNVRGDEQSFEQALIKDHKLYKIPAPLDAQESMADTLYYSWGSNESVNADSYAVMQHDSSVNYNTTTSDSGITATQDHAITHGLDQTLPSPDSKDVWS